MKSMVAFCLRVTLFPATKVHTYLGDEDGTQIDSRDRVVNNCEMKSSSEPFVIDEDYDMKERFTEVTGTRKSILIAFITTYGVRKNMYSGMISNQVKLEDLFAKETFKREEALRVIQRSGGVLHSPISLNVDSYLSQIAVHPPSTDNSCPVV